MLATPFGYAWHAGILVDGGPPPPPPPVPVRQSFQARWGLRLAARHTAPYGDLQALRAHHRAPYAELAPLRATLRMPYGLTQRAAATHRLGYALAERTAVAARHLAAWSAQGAARLQTVTADPTLTWQGRTLRIEQATLSCDEGSPVWIARIELATLADFALIGIGDALTLSFGDETFALVADGKTLSREQGGPRCEVSAVSPLALLDAPFAATASHFESAAVPAQTAVERLVGAVDWQLPGWVIPAGRLTLDAATPLAAARSIVGTIGGIIESAPDGTIVCRRRHPVSVPAYGQAAPAHALLDADILSTRAQIAPARGFNRVTVSNEDAAGSASADDIEYLPDEGDPHAGTVRAYLSAARPVSLAHTGHPDTTIEPLGELVRTETETVEVIAGTASTRYPVHAIAAAAWQHTHLGDISANGRTLTAATPGYSLVRITYAVAAQCWRVTLSTDEEVQFVLIDE